MAKRSKALAQNVPGNFFVDDTCIDCDACRKIAPECFVPIPGSSVVSKQPEGARELNKAFQALLSCPVGSIGSDEKTGLVEAKKTLPQLITSRVYYCGFNHKSSFGADSYIVLSAEGNWMVDAPRFVPALVEFLEKNGGLKYIYLTHRDDVADAPKYAAHFGAKRIIHEAELAAQPDAEIVLKGEGDHHFDQGHIMFTPGHTEGHTVLCFNQNLLFTGDHFAWLRKDKRFGSFHTACWYDWSIQTHSVEKMKVLDQVEWILPGHGRRKQIEVGSFPEIINDCVAWMKTK